MQETSEVIKALAEDVRIANEYIKSIKDKSGKEEIEHSRKYELTEAGARKACEDMGWTVGWTYEEKSLECYAPGIVTGFCDSCDRWRLLVLADGGRDAWH